MQTISIIATLARAVAADLPRNGAPYEPHIGDWQALAARFGREPSDAERLAFEAAVAAARARANVAAVQEALDLAALLQARDALRAEISAYHRVIQGPDAAEDWKREIARRAHLAGAHCDALCQEIARRLRMPQ